MKQGVTSSFIASVRDRARAIPRRIVFPETADPRVRSAIAELKREGIVVPVALLDASRPDTHAAVNALGVETIDPRHDVRHLDIALRLFSKRSSKGMTTDEATLQATSPLFFSAGLVGLGVVDGCVSGAVYTTADVLRAAMWLVGPRDGFDTVSSAFYMVCPPFRGSDSEVLTYTDCAVVPAPTESQLADIAISAARDRVRIVGDTPVVAFLSYSTAGSADGRSVAKVREAVRLTRERAPDIECDGELQADAALITGIAERKAPGSTVAGRANVLVFPSLDAGNITYKVTERIAGATAIGPILQGLSRPCNDLSRGASIDDIISVAAVTALQTV